MTNKKFFISVTALLLAATFALAGSSFGADIKQRMKDRLPAIQELMGKGIIGENNQGYLEFRGASREGQDIVNGENQDRQAVYNAIAKQQGSTPEHVGQRRAAQIAEIAQPGDWVQDPSGQWRQK